MDGLPGKDGKEIELSAVDTILRWRYAGDAEWTDLFSIPQPALVFLPHLWSVEKEIDLGDGSYGYRKKGTFTTSGTNQAATLLIWNPGEKINFIDHTGFWTVSGSGNTEPFGCSNIAAAQPGTYSTYVWQSAATFDVSLGIDAQSAITNGLYDIQIKYTKGST
ncbi:MAG: hypothetical protein FWD71_01320 [Oscillospiraceae bacterium]|nr:hypothetical protein [Oscillospiraceae bacterium]